MMTELILFVCFALLVFSAIENYKTHKTILKIRADNYAVKELLYTKVEAITTNYTGKINELEEQLKNAKERAFIAESKLHSLRKQGVNLRGKQ